MITIVGTGHVFDLSGRIYHLVQGIQPDLVAVELDSGRHKVLEMQRRKKERGESNEVTMKMLFKPSPVPFRFRLIALLQNKIAAAHDVLPGEEMLSAIDAARSIGVKIALIDRDINKTIQSLNKSMSFREKVKFYYAILSGFRITVGRREKGKGTTTKESEKVVERKGARESEMELVSEIGMKPVKETGTVIDKETRSGKGIGEEKCVGMDMESGKGKGEDMCVGMEMGSGKRRVKDKVVEKGEEFRNSIGKEQDTDKVRSKKTGIRSRIAKFFGGKSAKTFDPGTGSIRSQIEMIETDYDSVILELSRQFPGLKKALIDERDMNMANALIELNKTFGNIIVFVGEAHVEGMKRIMESRDVQPKIIHLSSLLGNSSSDVSFQITID